MHNNKQGYGKSHFKNSCKIVKKWCKKNKFDGAVWTALPSNFKEEIGKIFDNDAAVVYLKGLPETARANALRYIKNAPQEVVTPLRKELNKAGII